MIFSLVAMTGLEKCCITSAYLQWLCHSGERPVARGPLVFPIYLYRKLETSFCQKPQDRFHYNLAKMFSWWPSTKIFQVIMIHQKTWPLGVELIFPLYRKLEKIFLSETTGPISIWLGRNVSLVTLYQDCSSRRRLSKNMAARGAGLIFPIYLYRKLEKIFLSETTGPISI